MYSFSSASRRSRSGRSSVSYPKSFGNKSGGRQRSQFNVRQFINSYRGNAEPVEVEAYVPKHKFSDFALTDSLKKNIIARGYEDPTPIQDQVIDLVLQGRDVVGIANTGTGKSAAFLIPLINKALANRQERMLVVVPTRELALQLVDEFKLFVPGLSIYAVPCVGGASIWNQISNLKRHHNFVIGTPGRLKDLDQRGYLKLSSYSTVVLDEVDRMLDMGFIRDMQYLISKLPTQRQSLFFSATMNPAVEKVMLQFARDYIKVSVKTGQVAHTVAQELIVAPTKEDKVARLKELLEKPELTKVLVFVAMKHHADRLASTIEKLGYRVDSIHGDKRQNYRTKAMQAFRDGRIKVLVATDVAARGLDIADLSHVINFDLPETAEDYTHRIGRVGRAGNKGVAISFVER